MAMLGRRARYSAIVVVRWATSNRSRALPALSATLLAIPAPAQADSLGAGRPTYIVGRTVELARRPHSARVCAASGGT